MQEICPTFTAEYRLKRKDGSWLWIQDIGRVLERDAEGKAARAIGIHIDIHERKVFEETLFRANQDLEERVKRRTASLEESNESLRREISARSAVEEELRARPRSWPKSTAPLGLFSARAAKNARRTP